MASSNLSDRGQHLLKSLVDCYIRDGQPVGSKLLAEESGLPVSSATIRHVMADLEDRGFIASPHTSAGRIPTAKGYRLFIDSLITMQPPEKAALESLRTQLDVDKTTRELMESTSTLLSSITHQAGLVMLPKSEGSVLRQVEFLPLSGLRVLVILVMNEKEVQNRIIHTCREYTEQELRRVAGFLNERFIGKPLEAIRSGLVQEMQADKASIDEQMQSTIDMATQAFAGEEGKQDYLVAGQSHLLEATGPRSMGQLRDLFDAFQYKKDILHLMDRCVNTSGVQIFIGGESGYSMLDEFSVVTAPYQASADTIGVLGVIGPTRMAYERVIPIVDMTAKMLSAALK